MNTIKNSPILNAGYQFWNRYTDFTVSAAPEFWWGLLLYATSALLADGLGIYEAFSLISICPYFCMFARRLHDTGKSAWNLCWFLLPVVGWVLLIYMLCQPTDPKANKKYIK